MIKCSIRTPAKTNLWKILLQMILQQRLILMFLAMLQFCIGLKVYQIPHSTVKSHLKKILQTLNSTLSASRPSWQQCKTNTMRLDIFMPVFPTETTCSHGPFTPATITLFFFKSLGGKKNIDLCTYTHLQPTSQRYQCPFDRCQISLWNLYNKHEMPTRLNPTH